MTMDEYVRWLENRIAVVGTELEILLNARKAIEMAHGELDVKKAPLQPPQEKRLSAPKPAAKKQHEPQPNGLWQHSLAEVIRLITVAQPERFTSGEIIYRYYPGRDNSSLTKREKDRVYAALSYLKSKGDLVRSAQGLWSLSEKSSAALIAEQING